MKPILLLPARDGAHASIVLLEEDGAGGCRRVRLALGPGARCRSPPPALPAAELKVELVEDLLCVEYRET